ncbi:MAG: YqgE/AlgH family protein [Actinobacteria bacterium]|jgi:putative transcriptional regulator|nr:YqgE/AlgH family protein [Actinomycetota bacterium]
MADDPEMMPPDPGEGPSLRGRLLVASPRLSDPNFERTVVIVLEHAAEGALGLVLNRPIETPVKEILAPWHPVAECAPPALVFRGGPVAPNAVIGLVRVEGVAEHEGQLGSSGMPDTALAAEVERWLAGWRPVVGNVATIDLSIPPAECGRSLSGARLFSGYAGWGSEQLEGEIAEGAWFVVDAIPDDTMTSDPGGLWHAVLRRQHGPLAILGSYPPHPWVN